MKWMQDFFKPKGDVYNKQWRSKKSLRWHKIQLKWYYKFRLRNLQGWQKPESQKMDAYDKWYWSK